jgi:hypothetical protein
VTVRRVAAALSLALGLVGTYAASLIAPTSVKAFDAPGAAEGWGPWLFTTVMLAAPLLCLVSLGAGAYFFWRNRYAAGFVVAAVPAIVGALYLLIGIR